MPLGEEPITAYFPRVAGKGKKPADSSAKRKSEYRKDTKTNAASDVKHASADDPGPSRKRSRKATTSSLSSVSSGTPPPVWDLFGKAPKSKRSHRNHPINKASSVISLEDESDNDVAKARPSTGTTTVGRPSSSKIPPDIRKTAPVAKGKQMLHPKSAAPHIDVPNESTISLSEAPRQLTRKHDYNFSSTNIQLSSKTKFRKKRVDAGVMGDGEGDVEVMSSQALERQDEHFLRPSRDPTLRRSTAEATSTEDYSHQTDALSPPRSSNATLVADNKERSIIYDNDPIVDSSQTQNILLNYVSPHRPRIRKRLFVPDVDSLYGDENSVETIVQSSQTQCEIDLQPQLQTTKHLFKRSVFCIYSYCSHF